MFCCFIFKLLIISDRGILMNKEFRMANNNIIKLVVSSGYCCDTVSIYEGYIVDNMVSKSLELSIWDDMAFNAYTKDNNLNFVEFGVNINHPLYFCVKELLANDEYLVFDDDNTYEHMQKYMIIERDDDNFKFKFVNNINTNINTCEYRKFGVFIKNIGPDSRSKISDFSLKLRLVDFFRNVEKCLREEHHQLTFDECAELDRQKDKVKILRYSVSKVDGKDNKYD